MVLHRINGSQHDHPNPYINFIRVLGDEKTDKLHKNKNFEDLESARFIMKAVAAQVVPIMKAHGMGLNSFNEYEWNPEFSGRNWNGGEVIELVLRRKDGRFLPMQYLLTVMAHELAHIHHMNHGPKFQKLNLQLRQEIQQLQQKGYYGPGFWSSGQRLKDSTRLSGDGNLTASDLPEYTCGGSERKGTRRRVYRPKTIRQKKADRFVGEGQKLEPAGVSFFRKRANAATAKDARALAAEKRMLSMDTKPQTSKQETRNSGEGSSKPLTNKKHRGGSILVDEDQEESELVIELEDEWEEFEPQVQQSAADQENEKIGLRDEMKEILAGMNFQQQVGSSSTKRNRNPNSRQSSSSQLGHGSDDDEIQIISLPTNSASAQKRKLNDSLEDVKSKIPKVAQKPTLPHLHVKKDGQKPGKNIQTVPSSRTSPQISKDQPSSSLTIGHPSNSWQCLICCEMNHFDFSCCSSCLRPRGSPAPAWGQI